MKTSKTHSRTSPKTGPSSEDSLKVAIWDALVQSDRFNGFVKANFVIQQVVDHDEKTITVQVVETPVVVGPPLSGAVVAKLQGVLVSHGCRRPVEASKAVLRVLGQEVVQS